MTYLGLRPGEKLYEELLVKTEELDKTPNSMIFIERDIPLCEHDIDVKLEELKSACATEDEIYIINGGKMRVIHLLQSPFFSGAENVVCQIINMMDNNDDIEMMYCSCDGQIQGVIIVVGGFILAPFWGLSGIMIASCFSNLYRTIDLLYFVPKYITKGSVMESAIRMIRVILNIIVINIPCFLLNINPKGYLDWVVWAMILGAWAIFVTGVSTYVFDKKEYQELLKRIRSIMRR